MRRWATTSVLITTEMVFARDVHVKNEGGNVGKWLEMRSIYNQKGHMYLIAGIEKGVK